MRGLAIRGKLRRRVRARWSEKVDGRVDDEPHHVDEVPVDPGDLDAVMVLGGVVAAEGAYRCDREECQPDEDVRAVQAREPEEDGGEGAVAGVEANMGVLDRLREQERRPIRIVSTSPACSPRRWLRLIDWRAQCIVKLDVTSTAVLIPATNFGNSYGAAATPPARPG